MSNEIETLYNDTQIMACCVSLLYWESHKKAQTDSRYDAREVLKLVTAKEKSTDSEFMGDSRITLGKLIRELLDRDTNQTPIDYVYMKQLVRLAVYDNERIYQSIIMSIDPELSDEQIASLCFDQKKRITDFFSYKKFMSELKPLMTQIYYNNEGSPMSEQLESLRIALDGYQSKIKIGEATGLEAANIVAGFRSDDADSISNIWLKSQEMTSTDSVLRTGYVGLNKMLGPQEGMFRGDTIVVGALQHEYKSGMVLDVVMDVARNNSPYFFNEPKPGMVQKGAILHISLENSQTDDLMRMYRRIYIQENGTAPDIDVLTTMDPAEAAQKIMHYLGETGFTYVYYRMNPSEVGYMDVQQKVLDLELEGFEVHLLAIDYLSMLDLKGIPKMDGGTAYQELFRRMRNFCSEKNITLLTPHQLSVDATQLVRDGSEWDFVERVAGKSYWSRSKQIDREVDVEIVQKLIRKKTKEGTVTYITVGIGKNRRVHNIQADDRTFAMEFKGELGLLSDINEPKSRVLAIKNIRREGGDAEDNW